MLDLYLRRLSVRAKAEVRKEIARLRCNLASANAATSIIEGLRSLDLGSSVDHGLWQLHYELQSLRTGCNEMSLEARRAVCSLVPEERRRQTILSAMASISNSPHEGAPRTDWDASALKHGIVVSEAAIVDPVVFEAVIVRLQADGMSGKPSEPDPDVASPYFFGVVPDFTDMPSVWCAFAADLHPGKPCALPGSERQSSVREAG